MVPLNKSSKIFFIRPLMAPQFTQRAHLPRVPHQQVLDIFAQMFSLPHTCCARCSTKSTCWPHLEMRLANFPWPQVQFPCATIFGQVQKLSINSWPKSMFFLISTFPTLFLIPLRYGHLTCLPPEDEKGGTAGTP